MAISAPVLPAETMPEASPFLTALMAKRMELLRGAKSRRRLFIIGNNVVGVPDARLRAEPAMGIDKRFDFIFSTKEEKINLRQPLRGDLDTVDHHFRRGVAAHGVNG